MSHNIGDTNERESRREKKAKKAAEQWDQIQPNEKKRERVKKKKEKRNPSTLPPRGSAQTMAGSALGLGMEKEKASNVSLRKSETFRKTCIDWETCALTHQEWPFMIFFPPLHKRSNTIHVMKLSPSETKQNIIEHD